jgi:hypothetical protein
VQLLSREPERKPAIDDDDSPDLGDLHEEVQALRRLTRSKLASFALSTESEYESDDIPPATAVTTARLAALDVDSTDSGPPDLLLDLTSSSDAEAVVQRIIRGDSEIMTYFDQWKS